jgi:hypothetical protein
MLAVLDPGRERIGGLLNTAAGGVKVSAGLVFPFLALGAKDRFRVLIGAIGGGAAIAVASLAVFGLDAFDALGLIGSNQERTSRWSLPQRTADGIGALTGWSADDVVNFTRAGFGVALACVLVLLLYRTWQRPTRWVAAAGWATFAVLVATAWLVPWYAIWLVPLAALSADRRLLAASLAFCAYMLVIAVPL